jgi:hypothetical protein
MPRKRTIKAPTRADRAAKEVEYRAWKVRALADLANRHGVKAGIIPERLLAAVLHSGALSAGSRGSGNRERIQHDVAG